MFTTVARATGPRWRRWSTLGVVVASACIVTVLLQSCGDDGRLETGANRREDLVRLPVGATDLAVRGITDDDVELLARFPRLECFDLASGRNVLPQRITAKGIRQFCALPLPRLKEVLIARSDEMDDSAVCALASRQSIELLLLQDCGPFGVKGVQAMCSMPRLNWLDLRGCAGVTDESVPHLVQLRTIGRGGLRLTGTKISEKGIATIRAALGEGIVDTDIALWQADR